MAGALGAPGPHRHFPPQHIRKLRRLTRLRMHRPKGLESREEPRGGICDNRAIKISSLAVWKASSIRIIFVAGHLLFDSRRQPSLRRSQEPERPTGLGMSLLGRCSIPSRRGSKIAPEKAAPINPINYPIKTRRRAPANSANCVKTGHFLVAWLDVLQSRLERF